MNGAVNHGLLSFRLECIPPKTSHHAKRIVRIGGFSRLADKPELVEAKHSLEALLLPFQPAQPIPGPVSLFVSYTWPWVDSRHGKAGSLRRQRVQAAGRQPHTTKPDLTNVTKTLEDRLVLLRFLENDQSVAELHVSKYWGNRPGIGITIRTSVAEPADGR